MTAARTPRTVIPFDALVLDLDGVFVDATRSFRRAYGVAARAYVERRLGWRVLGRRALVPLAEVHRLKRHVLMNDPADTVGFLVLALVVAGAETGVLDSRARPIAGAVSRLLAAGSSVREFREALLGPLAPAARRRAMRFFDEEAALRLVRECYAGRLCPTVYGFAPTVFRGPGLCRFDRPLVDPRRARPSLPSLVFTGRTRGEAELVLRRFRFLRSLPERFIYTRERGVHKPEPDALVEAVRSVGARAALYVGDLPADLETVRRLRRLPGSPAVACALVGPARRGLGADLEASGLEQLLDGLTRRGLLPAAAGGGRA